MDIERVDELTNEILDADHFNPGFTEEFIARLLLHKAQRCASDKVLGDHVMLSASAQAILDGAETSIINHIRSCSDEYTR